MRRTLVVFMLIVACAGLALTVSAQDAALNAENSAFYRIAHFSPDADSIDIYLNGLPTDLKAVAYPDVSDWQHTAMGAYELAVVPRGADIDEALFSTSVNMAAGQWLTLAVVGSAADTSIQIATIEEDLDDLRAGTSRTTFFQGIEKGGGLDFYRNEVPYTTGLDFGETFTIDDDSDLYMYQVVTGGDDPSVVAELEDVDLTETHSYLVAAVGTPGMTGDAAPRIVVAETDRAEFLVGMGLLEAPGSVYEAIQGENLTGDLSIAIDAAQLAETLHGDGPYTVFAPAEFNLDDLESKDSEVLADILTNHVVEGELMAQDLVDAGTVTTVGGGTLNVRVESGNIMVNNARVLTVNIPAINGVVHLINEPLLPES